MHFFVLNLAGFCHILTWCFLSLKGELSQVLTFISGQYIAKQHSQCNDTNGKREKLADSSWEGSRSFSAMETAPLHRQHWQGLCYPELPLGLCKSLAVLTKKDTLHPDSGSVSVPAPSVSQISCCPSRGGIKPELCLQESHKPAESCHHRELPGSRSFPRAERGQGWPSGTADLPIPSIQEEPSGRATVSPPILHLRAPLETEIPLLTPEAHLCKALRVQGGVWGRFRSAAPADLCARGNAPILPGTSPQSTPIKCKMLNYSHSWPCIFPPQLSGYYLAAFR